MRVMPSGRARISTRRPEALGECPRCGLWRNRVDLIEQYQWEGNKLVYLGIDVCRDTCLDIPQPQFRTPILPPDPIPLRKPWPSPNITLPPTIGGPLTTSPDNQGFSTYILGTPSNSYVDGAPIPDLYPISQAAVLAATAQASGVPTPPLDSLASYVVPMIGNFTVQLVPNNPMRTFLLIYNPTQAAIQFSLATGGLGVGSGGIGQSPIGGTSTIYGQITNLNIGPGEAFFWATAQGIQPVYQGGMTAVGQIPGTGLWAWEDGTQLEAFLANDNGVLQLTSPDPDWPSVPDGLLPGAVWSNGLAVSVFPGQVPNPTAPPVFFGSITATTLLGLGGGNLPLTDPNNALQLWNNDGLVCVSLGGAIPVQPPVPFGIGTGRIGIDFIGGGSGGPGPSLDFSQPGNSQYIPVVL
jgi:hypothetical protein